MFFVMPLSGFAGFLFLVYILARLWGVLSALCVVIGGLFALLAITSSLMFDFGQELGWLAGIVACVLFVVAMLSAYWFNHRKPDRQERYRQPPAAHHPRVEPYLGR